MVKVVPLARFAVDDYRTTMPLYDTVNYGQSNACSLSNIFGCKVGLKYSVKNLIIHPDTIIADHQFSILTGF